MFTNPEQNILHLGLKEGMYVADFGSGSGFYSKAASKRIGITGKVYAIDVQKNLVKRLEDDIKKSGISNINCIWGNIEVKGGTKIADSSIDAVIISNVLFQTEDNIGIIDEARRILKKDGKVLLVEKGNEEKIKVLFEKRGFRLVEKISTNTEYYGIIFIYE
jgi:ubiquinone/menaquinone biosynthesis C-methylase UbiE